MGGGGRVCNHRWPPISYWCPVTVGCGVIAGGIQP